MKKKLHQNVQHLRAQEYGDLRNQIDEIWKFIGVLVKLVPADRRAEIPTEALAMLQHIKDVKNKFPKD